MIVNSSLGRPNQLVTAFFLFFWLKQIQTHNLQDPRIFNASSTKNLRATWVMFWGGPHYSRCGTTSCCVHYLQAEVGQHQHHYRFSDSFSRMMPSVLGDTEALPWLHVKLCWQSLMMPVTGNEWGHIISVCALLTMLSLIIRLRWYLTDFSII